MNLAAVHYHFGSKEALIHAVVGRRVTPLNAERLRRLDAIDPSAPRRERLLGTVAAFIVPPCEFARQASWGPRFVRLMGRAKMESGELFASVRREFFDTVSERFLAALTAVLPQLDPLTVRWRFTMLVGLMINALLEDPRGETDSHDLCDRVIAFAMAGLEAPVRVHAEKGPSS